MTYKHGNDEPDSGTFFSGPIFTPAHFQEMESLVKTYRSAPATRAGTGGTNAPGCAVLALLAMALGAHAGAQSLAPLDLPPRYCGELLPIDLDADGHDELLQLRHSGGMELSLVEGIRAGRLAESAPRFPGLTVADAHDVWTDGSPFIAVFGYISQPESSLHPRVQSISGMETKAVFERPLIGTSLVRALAVSAARSPSDFDFALSYSGRIEGHHSGTAQIRWAVDHPGPGVALGRADIDGDGDYEVLIGTSPIAALDASTGEETWVGTSDGAAKFHYANLDDDPGSEFIAVGGNPSVAIYGGSPPVLQGSWDGGEVLHAQVFDEDDDGRFELVVSSSGGRMLRLDGAGVPVFDGMLDDGAGMFAAHRFPGEAQAHIITGRGSGCSAEREVLDLDLAQTIVSEPTALGAYTKVRLADLGRDGTLEAIHTFVPGGSPAYPTVAGLRIVDAVTGVLRFQMGHPWPDRSFLVDFAASGAGGPDPGSLWLVGNVNGLAGGPWMEMRTGSDLSVARARALSEFGTRLATDVFLLPGSPGAVLLITAGGNSTDSSLRADILDPVSFAPVQASIPLADYSVVHWTEVVDVDGDGPPELVVRSENKVQVRDLPGGALRWETTTMALSPAVAVQTASTPRTIGINDNGEFHVHHAGTGAILDVDLLPTFEPLALGADLRDGDGFFFADAQRLWRYSRSARGFVGWSQRIGIGAGHRNHLDAMQSPAYTGLLFGSSTGIWIDGERPSQTRIFSDSFQSGRAFAN